MIRRDPVSRDWCVICDICDEIICGASSRAMAEEWGWEIAIGDGRHLCGQCWDRVVAYVVAHWSDVSRHARSEEVRHDR